MAVAQWIRTAQFVKSVNYGLNILFHFLTLFFVYAFVSLKKTFYGSITDAK